MMNYLIIQSLRHFHEYYGDDLTLECPTSSGWQMNLDQIADELSLRLQKIFLLSQNDRRPVYGRQETFQNDPHWRNYVLFYEYFHGDDGRGLGASNQTGWTALVANLIQGWEE